MNMTGALQSSASIRISRRSSPWGTPRFTASGLVILTDGTKYVSSVRYGSVSRIRPGGKAEVIASGIPTAASMGYDSKRRQLLIPMNNHNALAFLPLED